MLIKQLEFHVVRTCLRLSNLIHFTVFYNNVTLMWKFYLGFDFPRLSQYIFGRVHVMLVQLIRFNNNVC